MEILFFFRIVLKLALSWWADPGFHRMEFETSLIKNKNIFYHAENLITTY